MKEGRGILLRAARGRLLMLILGVDPGYAIVGYGLINYRAPVMRTVEYGAVVTKAGIPFEQRLGTIYDRLTGIMEERKPDVLSIEKLYYTTNAKTVIGVAEARGVILLAARNAGIPIFEYTPLQVKQAVTGYGKAEKAQVMAMTTRLLRLTSVPSPDDTADALAIAICHAQNSGHHKRQAELL